MAYGVYVNGCLNCPFLKYDAELYSCYIDDDEEISHNILFNIVVNKIRKYPDNCGINKHKIVAISLGEL